MRPRIRALLILIKRTSSTNFGLLRSAEVG